MRRLSNKPIGYSHPHHVCSLTKTLTPHASDRPSVLKDATSGIVGNADWALFGGKPENKTACVSSFIVMVFGSERKQ